MSKPHCLALLVAMVGVLIMPVEVNAQPTVDDSALCESPTFDEVVDLIKQGMNNVGLIREDLKAVNLIREDLEGVKNVLESNKQQNNASSIKENMEDLKAVFVASTEQQNNASSSISEAVNLIREDLEAVKNVLESNEQQNNTTCISKKDFEDLKAAFDASNQKQNNASSTLKKELEDLKAACTSNQQQRPQMEPSKQAVPSSSLCEYRTRVAYFL